MNETIMLKYLSWTRIACENTPFALVMDSFTAHATARIRNKAEALDIEIIPVHAGLTGEYQPLDRSCFGPLKKMSESLWNKKASMNPGQRWNHAEGAKLFEATWARLSRDTVTKGWSWNEDTVEESESESQSDDDTRRDPDFIEGENEATSDYGMSEPSSSGTWQGHSSRIELAMERACPKSFDPVIEVQCSLHGQPTVHQSWDETKWRMAKERAECEKKMAREELRDQTRRQKDSEAKLEKESLFPLPHARKIDQIESMFDQDGFLFPRPCYGAFHGS
jgi:hypothetical protein